MRTRSMVLLAIVAALSGACAKRVPEPISAARSGPHVTWVIMHGDRDNPDREFACQSDPRSECVVPGSKPGSRVFSDVHFYYHGAGRQTKFTGTVSVGFMGESTRASIFPVNARAEGIESIAYQSINGIVSSMPGTYKVMIDVVGMRGEGSKGQAVREEIDVIVR